ncbi:MAG: carbon-nitrogen hydrolase family protein [Alphaproteobacteria bacterium]
MSDRLVVACLQTNATADIETNLKTIEPMIHEARKRGAQFIALPENSNIMVRCREKLYERVKGISEEDATQFFARMAKETGTWILAGSLAVHVGHEKLANRSYMFSPEGKIIAHYDKIHMFDADISEKESYRESNSYRKGDRAVLADTPWGKIGMTICYDVRFPHLHRTLAKAGANIITVPAAFAASTGKLHWHILLRARAIETGCFIIAPAQCGEHDGGRLTFGHSLIIAPSGEIIAEGHADKPDIVIAELDMNKVKEARRMLPSLKHDCEFVQPC